MIAAAGFKFIRMDVSWQATERIKGTYDWSSYDELTANLEKRGIRPMYILCYSNSLYEDSVKFSDTLTGEQYKDVASPQHPESISAFSHWAAAAAEHFRGRNIIWEIWNEPNVSYWRPSADMDQYMTLTKETSKAIRKVDPDAVIIGPASSLIPLPFLESCMAAGLLEFVDAVSVHPYRDYAMSPETAGTDYRDLRKLIKQYEHAGKKNFPVINSEWGYASADKGVSLEKQAAFSVRMQLSDMLNGIPVSIWYDWKNDGNSPTDFSIIVVPLLQI